VRLFCLPHAGGSATAYRPWQALAEPWIDLCPIELPGHGRRIAEPPSADLDPLVTALLDGIGAACDRPFAFFGHSAGARLALACAHRVGTPPRHLFVSAADLAPAGTLHMLPDPDLIAALRRIGGTPAAVLEHPGMMAALLPAIRADLALAAEAAGRAGPPLAGPVTAFAGRADAAVSEAGIAAWAGTTSNSFTARWLPEGHFYSPAGVATVLRAIADALRGEFRPVSSCAASRRSSPAPRRA
jgi:surfactin synthase thioesterase subunit